MHWGVEFYREDPLDETFVQQVICRLVADGVRYNRGKYEGSYLIIGSDSSEDIDHREEEIADRTHLLPEFVAKYGTYDLRETILTLNLNFAREPSFPISLSFRPTSEGSNSSVVTLETHTKETEDEEGFLTFVGICKQLFESFEFVYGRYTNENYHSLPFDRQEFTEAPAQVVTFYSDDLAAEIGREKLRSAPVESVEELKNGVFLLACIDKFGACKEVEELREYLGQEKYQ